MKLAKWISAPVDTGSAAVVFKRSFAAENVIKAVIKVSGLGTYEARINGEKIGRQVLTPGWTSYDHRVQYQTLDITEQISENNTIAIGVGPGWAVGAANYHHESKLYADRVCAVAELELTYEGGRVEYIYTDESWDAFSSEVTFSDIYDGETIDKTAEEISYGKAVLSPKSFNLVAQVGADIVENDVIRPVTLIITPKGEKVIDFGQNMTGYVSLSIKGKRGERVVISHAEVLDKDGNFYKGNYRSAKNILTFVLSGEEDSFKPTYSFQGFRYIRLDEFPEIPIDLDSFRAIAVHSDMRRTGRFVCGDEKINQLYHNIIWGQKSNYLDIPTDCPQRDERLGWTGDAQVFCRTAAINYDVEAFFRKWLRDVMLEQEPSGAVRGIVPDAMPAFRPSRISAAWGDVACVAPYEMYLAYGSKSLLRRNFPMMKKWVEYLHSAGPAEYLWLGGYHYGDWLAMDAGADSYVGATANDLIASAFFAYSLSLTIRAGRILGEDVSYYEDMREKVVAAFREYFMENGMPKEEFPYTEINNGKSPVDTTRRGMTQTALVLILHFGLCTEEERKPLADRLAQLIRENGNRMTTGFVGTPYLLHVLSDNGYTDLAYTLLHQEQNPSWLYSVTHGATTMWEHWNSLKEDGSFWSTAMNSFNHYAYGAVYDWIFGVSSGIKPTEHAPAYKEITLEPHPDKSLGFADASIDSRNGKIRSYWYYKDEKVYYEFEIPEGVTAHLTLPSGRRETLCGGSYRFTE